jgi:formylglycine-generating enzyme required for sulfatase activity
MRYIIMTISLALLTLMTACSGEWTPVEQDFDGVTMVLVPAGCFDMGSDDGDRDEWPIHEICFDEPFWIDKYEVTNADYGSTETACEVYSWKPDQPRNCVNWFEARDHCDAREARLPTEAEWEYAARGPDSLVYPWGNEFFSDYIPNDLNSTRRPASVGSRPGGASWVGALDMSGNVSEWTSSLYEAYPYEEDHESNSDTNRMRVLRGGTYLSINIAPRELRSAYRVRSYPDYGGVTEGFRCARSYE